MAKKGLEKPNGYWKGERAKWKVKSSKWDNVIPSNSFFISDEYFHEHSRNFYAADNFLH